MEWLCHQIITEEEDLPEVLVDGNNFKVIRRRETFEHLIYDEDTFSSNLNNSI